MRRYPCLIAVSAIQLAIFNGSCSGSSIDAHDLNGNAQTVSSAGMLAVFDETIPEAHAKAYELLYEDINAISEAAEVVFIGRVVGYRQRLFVVPPSADILAVAEPDWEIVDVYDGIVLEADEVLLGEMPEAGSRITLGVRALQETLDGTSRSRLLGREIALFHDGIRSMGSDDAPRYLVYAGPSGTGGQAHALGLYWIRTRAGVVRANDDGTLGRGKGMPFAEVWAASEAGEYEWLLPYDLQDARDAAVLAEGGIEDTTGPPEEQTPDLEEGPVEQSGDGSDAVDPGDEGTPATDGGDAGSGDGDASDSGAPGETPGGGGGGGDADLGEPSGPESSGGGVGGRDAGDPAGQEDGGLDAGSRRG